MSLHKKVAHAISSHRARLIALRQLSNTEEHRAVLTQLIDGLDEQMRIADALVPEPRKGSVFPFEGASVGDCFIVEPDRLESARVAASVYGKKHGQKWTVGKRDDGSGIVRRAM